MLKRLSWARIAAAPGISASRECARRWTGNPRLASASSTAAACAEVRYSTAKSANESSCSDRSRPSTARLSSAWKDAPPSSRSTSAAIASASSRSSATARSTTPLSGMSVLAGISSRPGTSVPGRISCIAALTIVGADR